MFRDEFSFQVETLPLNCQWVTAPDGINSKDIKMPLYSASHLDGCRGIQGKCPLNQYRGSHYTVHTPELCSQMLKDLWTVHCTDIFCWRTHDAYMKRDLKMVHPTHFVLHVEYQSVLEGLSTSSAQCLHMKRDLLIFLSVFKNIQLILALS